MANGKKPLIIAAKLSILDVCGDPGYKTTGTTDVCVTRNLIILEFYLVFHVFEKFRISFFTNSKSIFS